MLDSMKMALLNTAYVISLCRVCRFYEITLIPKDSVCGLGGILTQVDNILFMHVLDAFTDLSHIVDHLGLRHGVALSSDPLKQFSSRQAVQGGEAEGFLVFTPVKL